MLGEEASIINDNACIMAHCELLRHAMRFHSLGIRVFPIRAGSRTPAVRWSHISRRRKQLSGTVEQMFSRDSVGGIAGLSGVTTDGRVLAFRDFDLADSYHAWASSHPSLASDLPTTKTRRGYHVAFLVEGDEAFQNCGDGEYRADSRHFCVLPPSPHPLGGVYVELVPWRPVHTLPVIDPISKGLRPHPSTQPSTHLPTTPTPSLMSSLSLGGGAIQKSVLRRTILSDLGKDSLDTVVEEYVPCEAGVRNHCLFLLAKRLKSMRSLGGVAPEYLEPVMRSWHARAVLGPMRTKGWEESWCGFLAAWRNVGPCRDGLTPEALREYVFEMVPLGNPYSRRPGDVLRTRLVCQRLQEASGVEPFHLASRLLGEILGIGHNASATILRDLVQSGDLVLVVNGDFKRRQAAEYVYRM